MKKLLLFLFAGTLFFASCTGPQGPQGLTGPTGNANVIGEDPFTVSAWTYDAASRSYSATFSDPNLTNDVYNYGLVEIYKYYSSGWTNLPDINGVTSTVFNFRPGYFDIYIYNTDGTTPAPPGVLQFRAVIIPSSYRQAHPNTNYKDYNTALKAQAEAKAATKVN